MLLLGYPVFEAGMALLPFVASAALCNWLGATLGKKFSNRAMVTTGMLVTATGFALLGAIQPSDGYLPLAAGMTIMGVGAGLATPAAVTALMGAVPPDHAGAGSAMNGTISQTGSALGVAALGSMLAAGYPDRLGPDIPDAARTSLTDALAIGDPHIVTAAKTAFVGAMSTVMLTGTALTIAASFVALTLLRRGKPKSTQDTEHTDELDLTESATT